jgi:hypothetical protein
MRRMIPFFAISAIELWMVNSVELSKCAPWSRGPHPSENAMSGGFCYPAGGDKSVIKEWLEGVNLN